MKFTQLYQETVDRLTAAGIDEAKVDALLLFDFCFGIDRTRLFLHGGEEVPVQKLEKYREALERRLTREPLHYITGIREFWSREFCVSPAVLVPRPETEFLIEHSLSICAKYGQQPGRILDMCTGSGVIAVVLAMEMQKTQIVAVDQSMEALSIAARNRNKFDMEDRIGFICSDLFTALQEQIMFDMIISNPPYIAAGDFDKLQPEVRSWEPSSALLAGKKGLDVIMRLADKGFKHLHPGGWLFIEIGADQGEEVERLFRRHPGAAYDDVRVIDDWAGRPRVLQARKRIQT